MARPQLKSPITGHYLVDPYTWPWSPNGHGHGHEWPTAIPFVQCQSALPFWDKAVSKFDHENPGSRSCVWSKVKVKFDLQNSNVKVMVKSQTHWSHLKPGVQSICFLFVSWQSDHFWLRYRKFHISPWKFKVKVMAKVKPDGHIWGLGVQSICLDFVSWQSNHFWLRYSKFYIWPWKFKVKLVAKVKHNGYIWALEFNRYVCFSFRGQGQTQWLHLSPRVQSICLLFVSWQSDHFRLRYSKFHIWPWKIQVKVNTKIDENLIR